jgi:RNA polymerase sigma-70 factor (ECF subfamily)
MSGGHGESDREPAVASLIAHAKDGDLAAFDTLMLRHQRQVFGVAWRLLGQVQDAQDASQEVFIRMYRSLDRFDETRELAPWLYRITVNVCRSIARKRKRRGTPVPLDDAPASALLVAEQGTRAVVDDETRSQMLSGLQQLPPKEREALVLRDIEGLSTREVAKTLGTRETTVRSQISRARVKMKAYRDHIMRDE